MDRWLRADVIQETATRLYPRWETLDHSLPLWNLAATVAMRVVHNHRRKESRVELVADPVPIHRDDVHLRGLQRAQLDKTRSALQQLNTDQRRVLLAEVGEAILPAGTRNRINVLRLRARARLREALGPWAPSAITIRFRYLRARVGQKRPLIDTHVMANCLVNVAMAATLGMSGAAAGVETPEVGAANTVPSVRARMLSLEELRSLHLDRMDISRPEPPNISRARSRAKERAEGVPGFFTDVRDWADDTRKWAEEDSTKHPRKWAKDWKKSAEDDRRTKRQRKWAKDTKEWAQEQKEWAEDQLP